MTADSMPLPLVDVAIAYVDAGLSVIVTDGEKRPLHSWKEFQARIPSHEEVAKEFFDARAKRIAIVCGPVSGNLECLDFDNGGSAFPAWAAMVEDEAPGLLSRLPMETTPSGGRHVVYRVSGQAVGSGSRLAMDAAGGLLIETRADRQYFCCSPSPGYAMVQSDLRAIPTITPDERATMIRLACSLDESPIRPPPETAGPKPGVGTGDRPGDDFNQRGNVREILQRHGWVYVRTVGPNEHWRRPGKERGMSATIRGCDGVDVFFPFTTSTVFEARKPYSPFRVYAILDHAGDYSAAASALRQQGYGATLPAEPAADDGVDISGILEQHKAREDREAKFPRRCLNVGGFLGDVMAYTLAVAPIPNPIAALGGAIAFQAVLCGRRVIFLAEAETRSNCYLIVLSGSGTGKNAPRKTNNLIIEKIIEVKCRGDHDAKRILAMFADDFASGQGIESSLAASPSILFQIDEMDKRIKEISDSRDRHARDIERRLMQFYSSSTMTYYPDKRAKKEDTLEPIANPNLCLFGTATPGVFYDSLSMDSLRNGLIGRLIPFESKEQPKRLTMRDKESRKGMFEPKLPNSIIETAWHWLKNDWPVVKAEVVPYDRKVVDILSDSSESIAYAKIEKAVKEYGPECAEATIWSRFNENRNKMILIRACSDNPLRPHITREIAEWGIDLIEYSCRLMCEAVRGHVADNQFHKLLLKTLEVIRIQGKGNEGGWVYARDIYRALNKTRRDCDDIFNILLEQGKIVLEKVKRNGNDTFKIRLIQG